MRLTSHSQLHGLLAGKAERVDLQVVDDAFPVE